MKAAIIRWKQPSPNPKRHKAPLQVDAVLEVGEGPHFIHIFCEEGSGPLREVNLNADLVESVTLYEVQPAATGLVDENGEPLTPEALEVRRTSGDEAQSEERLPVEQKDAGATPVVPAISDAP